MNTRIREGDLVGRRACGSEQILFRSSIRMRFTCPYNALPVDVASGSCPEVSFWEVSCARESIPVV
jgi:hypothetical protein